MQKRKLGNSNLEVSALGNLPCSTPEAHEANQALVALLGRIAEDKRAKPAQIALAWWPNTTSPSFPPSSLQS